MPEPECEFKAICVYDDDLEEKKAIGKLTTSILGTMRFVARRELIELIRTHGLEE